MFVASHAGLGQHETLLSADAVKTALLYSNILDILYTPIMLAAKVSILIQVDRMFSGNKQRMIFWSVRALAYVNVFCYTVMLAEITAIMYMACCPAFPRLIQYIRGTKTVKPTIRGFKNEKDLFSPTSSFSSSKPNTPEQKHGWGSPIITPPTPPKGSPKITPPTPPNGSPTLPAGFIPPQKPSQASVRVTPGPAQGLRGTQSEDRPRGPFRTLSLPVKPSVPRTSFKLPAARLEPKGPRLNFSIPVRPTPEQLANQSSLSPRYVPEEKTAALAKKAEGVLQNYAPFERRISHLSYTSRHTAALEEIRQSLEEVRHSLDGGFIDSTPTPTSSQLNVPPVPGSTSTPKTPTTPGPHTRSSSLAPPASPGSPASPARTEFSVHLVESAVRMKIMPVYFAQRRKKSQDMRASIASLGNQSIKPMHSFKRSKHARVPSTPGLQTHFEIP
ncbi:hypothetical protein SLS60_008028 [Paraconiothyrium brasiliense]|uniref:Rhodopsin domain-containing protein n=1 Tax=Paraconiothyrium brasiliense TaxID=300254 RepID=A0ABR3R380_9PLEO